MQQEFNINLEKLALSAQVLEKELQKLIM